MLDEKLTDTKSSAPSDPPSNHLQNLNSGLLDHQNQVSHPATNLPAPADSHIDNLNFKVKCLLFLGAVGA